MLAYGFSDWDGNDRHFMGWAGTGVHFDPIIAQNAAHWLRKNSRSHSNSTTTRDPWFLTVALVNPHDVMWYPIDQPDYLAKHEDEVAQVRALLEAAAWKDGDPLPTYTAQYDSVFDSLPISFADNLHTKPEAHRQWRWDQQHGLWGYIDPKDTKSWLRHLDYYLHLHKLGDDNLGTILSALDESGDWDNTIVIYTSDHGDMCGSHGLRSKGPFVYEEIMNVPLYISVPGMTRHASKTDALASHVDLATTICSLAGVATEGKSNPDEYSTLQGVDLTPVLSNPEQSVKAEVLFAQDSAQTSNLNKVRYALRGYFDGRYKYARYYGVGGGKPSTGLWGKDPGVKLYDVNCDFDDQDHELYDLTNDPYELVNLANDPGFSDLLRDCYERLKSLEHSSFYSFEQLEK